MPGKIAVSITDNVSDTLFIPLYMRCLETRRSGGLISDPLACEMVENLDYDFARYDDSRKSQLGTAIRVRHFDRAVRDFVAAHDDPVVVNIGAGLDTRFQRVDSGRGVFYEVDLPEVIAFRSGLVPESKRDVHLACSMFEPCWMDEVRDRHPGASFIIVAEGVFMYFEEEEVRALVRALCARLGPGELHFDACSPWAVRNSHRHDTVKKTNAPFRWGLVGDGDLEGWEAGLRFVKATYFMNQERSRWGLSGLAMSLVPSMGKAFRMLHYKMGPAARR